MKRKEKAELVVTQWINDEVKIWGGGIAQIGVGDKRRIFLVWGRDREKLIGYAPLERGQG
jgi:hypothetical protein